MHQASERLAGRGKPTRNRFAHATAPGKAHKAKLQLLSWLAGGVASVSLATLPDCRFRIKGVLVILRQAQHRLLRGYFRRFGRNNKEFQRATVHVPVFWWYVMYTQNIFGFGEISVQLSFETPSF